ncbi:MAG TPA: ABC transporter ATP-binding protein [Acidimicrobiia bacterium]|nr:ABC transporter ATP-binding protein [Acidimicrobiia bacterium]
MFTVESVTAGYGDSVVLRDVTVAVPPRSVVAVVGANGAGKTTLLRVASGLLRPSRGRLLLDGEDVTGSGPDGLAAAGICHVPEGQAVFPELTVRENLRLFSPPGREGEGIERAVAAFPPLRARLSQTASTMSGGEQQMLALTRAAISGARVILLDEVSMGLAPVVVDRIYEFLDRVRQGDASVVLVEQYVGRALAIADYVYVIGRGRVTFAGDPAELADDDLFNRYLGLGLESEALA